MNLEENNNISGNTTLAREGHAGINYNTGQPASEVIIQLSELDILIPDWTYIHSQESDKLILKNPNGYTLPVFLVVQNEQFYLIIGNSTYKVLTTSKGRTLVNLENLNAVGNYHWFRFFNPKYFHIISNLQFPLPFEPPNPGEVLRLFPANPCLHPMLLPPKLPAEDINYIREKLAQIIGSKSLKDPSSEDLKRIKYNFFKLINYLAIIARNGCARDYYDAQQLLGCLKTWVENRKKVDLSSLDQYGQQGLGKTESVRLIVNLKEYLLLCRTGVNWQKWARLTKKFQRGQEDLNKNNSNQRTKTIFERNPEPSRLRIPPSFIERNSENRMAENWQVSSVEALGRNQLQPLASKEDVEKARDLDSKENSLLSKVDGNVEKFQEILDLLKRAAIFGFGQTLISNAIMVSLAFAGGSATTVKKIMRKNKLVHLALKVKSSLKETRWISLLQARAGFILGQHPLSKIVFITNIEGTLKGESESSTLEFLENKYSEELDKGQIYNVNQRTGFIMNPETGELLRFKDGSLATAAENHLWAFFALLLDKKKVLDIIQNTTGIVSLGNGDNILNYPRAGMLGEIEYARRLQGRAIATVAIAALSAGDKKGGFAAKVEYTNTKTGDKFEQVELREISEFPTKGDHGFSAIDVSKEDQSEFYKKAQKNRWFIEDIFKNPDGTDKSVAFNVAFYAVDLRLILSRIFGLNEKDCDLVTQLQEITNQHWVDRILQLGEAVPSIEQLNKSAPNEDGSEEVTGYQTEQMVQDFIVNSLALLKSPEGFPEPEVVIRLAERKDFFLPYKGKKQHEIDEHGNVVTNPTTGKPNEDYDLIANQKRYAGVVKDHLKDRQRLVLGTNEFVEEVLPVDFETVKKINEEKETNNRVLFS